MLEGTAVELLRAMVEEADDLPQSQLDILLTRLLPAHAAEAPASHAATKALLQRTQTTVQPYLQRLLTGLLSGARSDSELRGDYHSVFYAVGAGAGPRLLSLLACEAVGRRCMLSSHRGRVCWLGCFGQAAVGGCRR